MFLKRVCARITSGTGKKSNFFKKHSLQNVPSTIYIHLIIILNIIYIYNYMYVVCVYMCGGTH